GFVRIGGAVGCGLNFRWFGSQEEAFGDPLFSASVDQADVLVAVIFQLPEGVGGEPVVVVAVEKDGGVAADAGLAEEALELGSFDEIAANGILKLGLPVPGDGAGDVPLVVSGGIH